MQLHRLMNIFALSSIQALFASTSIAAPASNVGLQESVQNMLNDSLYLEIAEEQAFKSYPGIPDTFPEFEIPIDFEVRGGTSQFGSQQLVLETRLRRERALVALSDSIKASGFVDYYELAGRPLNEFIVTEITRSTRIFCSDDRAYLSLLFIREDEVNSVVLTNTAGASLPHFVSCQDEAQRPPGFSVYGNELRAMMQYAPVLDLPSDAIVIQAPVIGNTSRSSDTYKTSAIFVSDLGLSQLLQFFTQQMEKQSWQAENQSIDNGDASHNWLKYFDDGHSLNAEIAVEHRDAARYLLRMEVSRNTTHN